MKQVARYSRFLFSIVFRRWSYYVSTFVYLLVLAAVLFLVSAVLNKPVSITLMYYGFNMMVVLAGAITAAIYAVQLFRAGIDDGTELLVTAKSIKRNEMLAGKCIVLTTLIFMLSLLSMCLGFLTYYTVDGEQTFTYVGGGVFLATLLVLLFFSGVALVFCLITKKMGATLATIGTCFFFMMYCFADTILSTGPANYVKNKNIDISIMNPVTTLYSEKNTFEMNTIEGAIAKNTISNNPISYYRDKDKWQKANWKFLGELWHRALVGSSRYSMMVIDPIFQWSELMNLQNYLLDTYQSGIFYRYVFSEDSITNGNLRFGNKEIDLNNFLRWTTNYNIDGITKNVDYILIKNANPYIAYGKYEFTWPNALNNQLSNTIFIPEFVPGGSNLSSNPTNKYVFKKFNVATTKWEEINNYLFVNNSKTSNSIIEKYKSNYDALIKANLISNMSNINNVSILQTYLVDSYIDSINLDKYPLTFKEYDNYIKSNNLKIDLKNLNDKAVFTNLLINKPEDLYNNLMFINKIAYNTMAQIQTVAFKYLSDPKNNATQSNTDVYRNALSILGIESINQTFSTNYKTFVMPYWVLEGFVKIAQQPQQTQDEIIRKLIKLIDGCFIHFNAGPLTGTNQMNMLTFNSVKIVPYMTLGGVLGVWFTLTFILLIIGTILYSRKDFI